MDNKEYKNSEEVKKRAEEAIGRPFKEIFESNIHKFFSSL